MESLIHMRRILKLSLTCLAAGAVTACEPDTVIPTEALPFAGVRFINAVPDTASMDFRFVDLVESNPHWNMQFRGSITTTGGVPASTAIAYKGAREGQRHFRVFMNGNCNPDGTCDQSFASTVVIDQTVTLVAGRNYTAILWGYANPGRTPAPAGLPAGAPAMRLDFVEETVADPGAQVALRVINATAAAIDVEAYLSSGAETGTPQWNDLAALTMGPYINVAPTNYTNGYLFDVRDGGGASLIATDARALQGDTAQTAAPGPFEAQPGARVAGSALSAIVWPRSVAGTDAPNVTSTSISFVWDRRPPRPPGV